MLEIKQGLSRLTARERREVQVYLHQLKRRTPAWRKAMARNIDEVRAGKATTIEELEQRYPRTLRAVMA